MSRFVPDDEPFVPLRTAKDGLCVLWLVDIARHDDNVTYLYEVLGTGNTHQYTSLTVNIGLFHALRALGLMQPEQVGQCVHTADGWCIVGIIYPYCDRKP